MRQWKDREEGRGKRAKIIDTNCVNRSDGIVLCNLFGISGEGGGTLHGSGH